MRGTLTKLLTVIPLFATMLSQKAAGQCALITDNYSGQVAGSVCAPVNLNMDVRYKFILPVDPSRVEILYVWNDGTGATTQVPAISQGDTVFTATASHLYPPSDQCSYTAEAYVVYDGQQCVSSSRQEQTFSAWARDNQNGAVIITDPVVAQFCEGEDIVDVVFADNSTFNCNINVEPDKPNRITRWVQFIYGTTSIGGDRIPNITIRDPLGNIYQMTDADGNSLPPVPGPIVEIPIPADGPTEISWPISAPAGGIAGDIFEITLRNWNICNPYDRNPFDAVPPSDLINGDNPPITTTALIEIITTPPEITNPSLEFCAGSPINLTLSTSGGQVNWYTDSLLTHHIHTGNSFNPVGAPTYIDNTTGGTYSYWVTETIGACASAPSRVSFRIFDIPVPAPDAGDDAAVCDNQYTLNGNTPVIGTGRWTTTSLATIDDPLNPQSQVYNLSPGPNLFRWTITNGPCISVDEVLITSDQQPDPANAGPNQQFCNNTSTILAASAVTNNGIGTWTVAQGNGAFNDSNNPHATVSSLAGGVNQFAWTIRSRYGVCNTTTDTVRILRDRIPSPANAGPDRGVCDSSAVNLSADSVDNGGTGSWSVISGTSLIDDIHDPATEVSNIGFGNNQFRWTAVSEYNICPGSSDVVTITRDEAPAPANAGADQMLCSSVTSPLGANNATVGTATWSVVSAPVAVPPIFSPSINNPDATVQIAAGNAGVYEFAWTIVNASCITSDTVRVDFGMPVPPADAGPADSVCGTQATLSANSAGRGTGTWSLISGPGEVAFIPGNHSSAAIAQIDEGDEGLYTFEWRIESGSCPPTADTVSILFKPTPGAPFAADGERCGPGTLVLTSTTGSGGDINRWYDNPSGGPLLSEGNSFTTPVLSSAADYWVSSINLTNGCESPRRRVNITIHDIPSVPVVSDIQHCGNVSATIPAAVGNYGTTNRWYDVSSGGVMLAEADTFVTPVLTAPVTYWVSSYNAITGCEGERVPVHVQIDIIPGTPVAYDTARCGEGALTIASTVGVNGNHNQWFDAQTGGTLLDTTASFATPYLTSTTSYWVSTISTTTGCVSPRQRVMVNIHPIPGFPVAPDVTQCGPDTVVLMASAGLNGTVTRWYDSLTGGSVLMQDEQYVTEYLTNTRRYYVSTFNESTGCESSRREVMAVILPVPSPQTIIGPEAVGINQTNVIYSVNFQPGSTYDWAIPPGMNLLLENQNFVIVEFPNIGTYNISVTETNSLGCEGPPAVKTIDVKADLIVLDITPKSGNGCINTNLQLSAVPTGGTPSYTFVWGGDVQYLNATNISNPIFNAPSEGNYMITISVNDINLNNASDTIYITVYPNPEVVITSDSLTCTGADLPLNANVSGGSGIYPQYLWSGQTTPLSDINIPNPVFNTFLKGTYHLKFSVTDNHGCMAADSVSILNDAPRAIFVSDAEPGCSPLNVHFTNNSEDAISYSWNFGDGNISAEANPVHTFSNTSNSVQYFNVQLTAVNASNCIHTTNEYIVVYPNPPLVISTFPDNACAPADILLSSTPGGLNYQWNFGDGQFADGDFNIMHTFVNDTDKDTVFLVRLVSTSFFGCVDSGQTLITVHPSPRASFTLDPSYQMIPDRTIAFTNTTEEGNWEYLWKFGDSTYSELREPLPHTYPGAGNYLIYLVVRGEHCSDSVWESAQIVPHPPIAAFMPVEPGCMPLTIQFQNTSMYSNSYLWEFGDGAVSNKPNPQYTYYEPGTYTIKLTAWGDDGSASSYSTNNDVYVLPNAFFDIKPRRVYANDQAVLFENQSDNGAYPVDGNTYLWDFGDGNGSQDVNPVHLYEEAGSYNVTLNVWTDKQCYDVYEYQAAVLVEPVGTLKFPNVFSPEASLQENRVFKPALIDFVEDYHLMIFNRWGELIFESFDKDMGWDGMINGTVAKEDVYIWRVEGKYTSGLTFEQTGDVTLLR